MISIIIVDFNAKVGQDNTGYERVMGKYGSGTMNEDILQILWRQQFTDRWNIIPTQKIHKLTWVSP